MCRMRGSSSPTFHPGESEQGHDDAQRDGNLTEEHRRRPCQQSPRRASGGSDVSHERRQRSRHRGPPPEGTARYRTRWQWPRPSPPTKPSQIGNPWPAMTAAPPNMSCQVGRSGARPRRPSPCRAGRPPRPSRDRRRGTGPTLPSPLTRMSTPGGRRMSRGDRADQIGDAGDRHRRAHRAHFHPSVAGPPPDSNLPLWGGAAPDTDSSVEKSNSSSIS